MQIKISITMVLKKVLNLLRFKENNNVYDLFILNKLCINKCMYVCACALSFALNKYYSCKTREKCVHLDIFK